MIRRRFPLSLPALAASVAIALAAGCSSHAEPSAGMPPPPEVSVATVLTRPVRAWDEFTGRVAAVETVDLRPRVSGYVQRVAYREGQDVHKGELLFVIDPRPYRAALDRALADLERARSEARLARRPHARAQPLIEATALSRAKHHMPRCKAFTRTRARARRRSSRRATHRSGARAAW